MSQVESVKYEMIWNGNRQKFQIVKIEMQPVSYLLSEFTNSDEAEAELKKLQETS